MFLCVQEHGIQDLGNEKPTPKKSKVGPSYINSDSIPGSIKDWKLVAAAPEKSNLHVSTVNEASVVDNNGPLITDANVSSRVVEIELNDSHQAVATVTLGRAESVIPENWYE